MRSDKFGSQLNSESKTCFFSFFKACVRYFFKTFYFSPNESFKTYERFFISSKKLFSFSRYSIFVFSPSPIFLPVSHRLRDWSKINLKDSDVINCLNKNLVTHFVWYLEKEKKYNIETLAIDTVLNKKHFYEKIMQKMYTKS